MCAIQIIVIIIIVIIDDGKWFAAKVFKESSELQASGSSISLPFIPLTGWGDFPSHCIPSL